MSFLTPILSAAFYHFHPLLSPSFPFRTRCRVTSSIPPSSVQPISCCWPQTIVHLDAVPFIGARVKNTADPFTDDAGTPTVHNCLWQALISTHRNTQICHSSSLCGTLCIMKYCFVPSPLRSIVKGFISFHRCWKNPLSYKSLNNEMRIWSNRRWIASAIKHQNTFLSIYHSLRGCFRI